MMGVSKHMDSQIFIIEVIFGKTPQKTNISHVTVPVGQFSSLNSSSQVLQMFSDFQISIHTLFLIR